MTEIAFEHFDPKIELGSLDVNGCPVRPRKKPGRKPNPPSPSQRKAQNRAAQRAFRERKRREMREAEATIKRSTHIRDQAIRECKKLRRKVKELRYENNYLKGYILTLKMACNANRVDVPILWESGPRDDLGSESLLYSRSKHLPQSLEIFLDKDMHIIGTDAGTSSLPADHLASLASSAASVSSHDPNVIRPLAQGGSSLSPPYSHSSIASMGSPTDGTVPSFSMPRIPEPSSDLPPTSAQPPSQPATGYYGFQTTVPIVDYLMQAEPDNSTVALSSSHRRHYPMASATTPTPHVTTPETGCATSGSFGHDYRDDEPENVHLHTVNDPTNQVAYGSQVMPGGWEKPTVTYCSQPAETPLDPTTGASPDLAPAEKKYYPPMTPLEFATRMPFMRPRKNGQTQLFTPTELQRNVPHDLRIDFIPGATLRDHMIIFQDFYDANELFNFLLDSAMFLGGSPGNTDCWFVPPVFFQKYWFLCPNHVPPYRLDNAVDIVVYMGQRMVEKMTYRKQMYIERDHYISYFPSPTVVHPSLEQIVENDSGEEDDKENNNQYKIGLDVPFDVVMDVMQTLPRLTSTKNSYPF